MKNFNIRRFKNNKKNDRNFHKSYMIMRMLKAFYNMHKFVYFVKYKFIVSNIINATM